MTVDTYPDVGWHGVVESVSPAAGTDNAFAGGNRFAITACAIVATLMQALDTTIANVALPYMQGSACPPVRIRSIGC